MSRSSLGPANMSGVTKYDLVLAEMISNAEEHELAFTVRRVNVDNVEGLVVPTAECACAIGAYEAFKPALAEGFDSDGRYDVYAGFQARTGLSHYSVYLGNDASLIPEVDCPDAAMVGIAYHAYHEANPNDPVIAG